jgi:multidrug efflux system membrane fusion protein
LSLQATLRVRECREMAETTTHAAPSQVSPPHARRNASLALIGLVLAGWLIWYLALRGGSEAAPSGRGRPSATVGVAQAELADVPVNLSAIGTVQPVVVATVRPQLAGTLFSIDFEEGQWVSKGQLLAQMDPRPYRLALSQAEGMLRRDQALLAGARADL